MKYRLIILLLLIAVLIALQFKNYRQRELKPVAEPILAVYINSTISDIEPALYLQRHDNIDNLAIYGGYRNYLKTVKKEFLDSFYFEADTEKKVVVLSFDDGPLAYTKRLMAILEEKQVAATFFLLCSRLNKSNSSWYNNSLFSVGMHSLNHKDYRDLSLEETNDEFSTCSEIFDSYGLAKEYFRPAYGVITAAMVDNLEKYGLKGILWSLDSGDWDGKSGETLVSNVLNNIKPGAIILFHDGVNPTDLKAIIDGIHDLGFQIVTLAELLEYPKLIPDY